VVNLEKGSGRAISAFLADRRLQKPVRIELRFTGCCESSLGLRVDEADEGDLMEKIDGLTFVIAADLHDLVGDVTISSADDGEEGEFILTSSKPLNEWAGFAACKIKA